MLILVCYISFHMPHAVTESIQMSGFWFTQVCFCSWWEDWNLIVNTKNTCPKSFLITTTVKYCQYSSFPFKPYLKGLQSFFGVKIKQFCCNSELMCQNSQCLDWHLILQDIGVTDSALKWFRSYFCVHRRRSLMDLIPMETRGNVNP